MSRYWRDRPTLVTGATGLLGSWLIKSLLIHQADVVCLVRDSVPQSEAVLCGALDRVKVVHADVRDRDGIERALGEYEIDTVFHLAAQTVVGVANRNPISTFESNVAGTWNVLESCRRSPSVKSIVVASSDKAYGEQQNLPYAEHAPLEGRYPYDVSKSCADLIAQAYAATYKLPVAITRCGNFYGGGDLNWSRIVPGTIRAIVRGERPVIRSDGTPIRDYFYVEDGAACYMLLAEQLTDRPSLRGAAFNFSNEIQISVLDLVERILKHMGSSLVPDVRNETSHEIRRQYLTAERAHAVLGWHPSYSLEEGIARTISWYRDYFGGPEDECFGRELASSHTRSG